MNINIKLVLNNTLALDFARLVLSAYEIWIFSTSGGKEKSPAAVNQNGTAAKRSAFAPRENRIRVRIARIVVPVDVSDEKTGWEKGMG